MLFISSWNLFSFFLSWNSGRVKKPSLIRNIGLVQNVWCNNLVNKQLQYTNCPISHKVKATKQLNLVRLYNITRQAFCFKNHAENKAGRLGILYLFLFLKKLCMSKTLKVCQLGFNLFQYSWTCHTIKTNRIKLDYEEICLVLNF